MRPNGWFPAVSPMKQERSAAVPLAGRMQREDQGRLEEDLDIDPRGSEVRSEQDKRPMMTGGGQGQKTDRGPGARMVTRRRATG